MKLIHRRAHGREPWWAAAALGFGRASVAPAPCGPGGARLELIHQVLSDYGYVAAFLLVFAAGAGLPSPGALVIVIAGALVPAGYFRLEALLPVLIVANVLGDVSGYGIARRFTRPAVWARRAQAHRSLARLERSLKRRPTVTVIASRFVPFVNGGVNGLSGMCRLSPAHFVSADFIGNFLYVTAHVLLGLAFGKAWGDAAAVATVGGLVGLGAAVLVIGGVLLVREAEAEAEAEARH